MAYRLNLDNIQGNIVPGFKKSRQVLIFARFSSRRDMQRWLAEIVPDVSTAREVALFNRVFKQVRGWLRSGSAAGRLGPGRRWEKLDPETIVHSRWLNVAFTSQGLARLIGGGALGGFSEAFQMGLADRAQLIKDDVSEIARWDVGGLSGDANEPDVLLMLAADSADELERMFGRHLKLLGDVEARPPDRWINKGRSLDGAKEHFGFRDDISQPDKGIDLLDGWPDDGSRIRPGEFVMGYETEGGAPRPAYPAWARDGSYLVFRRLQQNVRAFRSLSRLPGAAGSGLSNDRLAALFLGRWQSGAPLRRSDRGQDPGTGPGSRDDGVPPDLDFAGDDTGLVCPLFSHVRRANPRTGSEADRRHHRLIRRGIPYGSQYDSREPADDMDRRGLLFLACQSSIERQFEHIQAAWLNSPNFLTNQSPRPGPDPVMGLPQRDRVVSLARQDGGEPHRIALGRFVTVRGGVYLFAPPIAALKKLAAGRLPWQAAEEEGAVSYGNEVKRSPIEPGPNDIEIDQLIGDDTIGCALGGLIIDEIPYSSQRDGSPVLPRIRNDILHIPPLRRSVTPDDRNDRPGPDGRVPARERVNNESVLAYGPLASRARRLNNTVSPVVEPSSYGDVQESLWWEFGGRARRVTKALRLVVWYRADGEWRREHILVGYEGAGGDS